MKKYTYNLERNKALSIANSVGSMSGRAEHKILRHKIVKEILRVWPELDPENEPDEKRESIDPKEVRTIEIKSTWLRSYGVGLVGLLTDQESDGRSAVDCLTWAKWMRLSGWVEKQIPVDKVEEFDEEMDGEGPLIDEESELTTEEQ